jgi:benzoyl-CoA reductase/2-hydroxyglutaryl-CoA dehydratase subunit BcrC/BadD/HgdB
MNVVAYCHPFVPPEWIAAHGLCPRWLACSTGDEPAVSVRRGVCPVAAAVMDGLAGESPAAGVVLTTTCDQMRYAAAVVQHREELPVFLLHVPRVWQTAAARGYYRAELSRLARFLVECGGTAPSEDVLAKTMLRYDEARESLRLRRGEMSARCYAQAIAAVRDNVSGTLRVPESSTGTRPASGCPVPDTLRLALVGGPMSPGDYEWLTGFEGGGARFVLDASESGERTLPADVDIDRLQADPLGELVRIYFDSIPTVFQRPNDRLYEWLREQLAARDVRGIVVRRYVWCDHWHGELPRLREQLGLPILEWDGTGDDLRTRAGGAARMEAFLEMLR